MEGINISTPVQKYLMDLEEVVLDFLQQHLWIKYQITPKQIFNMAPTEISILFE